MSEEEKESALVTIVVILAAIGAFCWIIYG